MGEEEVGEETGEEGWWGEMKEEVGGMSKV